MSAWLYNGFDLEGERKCGSCGFSSEAQVKEHLDKRGVTNYRIFESKTVYKRGDYRHVSPKELSIFCKQMSVLFYSHIMLMDGVLVLAEQTDNKQLKLALNEIHTFMESGMTFAETMCMYEHMFPTYLLNMIVIGETSGTLDAVFSRMSSYFDKEHKIRKGLREAIAYPAILSALMAAIIILLIVKILPMFDDILKSMGTNMPQSARIILDAGAAIVKYGPMVIIAVIIAVIAVTSYVRTEKGRYEFDRLKLKIPAYRYVYSRVITSRFARSMAILLKSGVQLLNALKDVTVLTDNKYLEQRLAAAVEKVKQGGAPIDALNEIGVFPPLFQKLFVIGEKTGNLDEMLEKSASVFDDEADDAIKRFSDMLEPALIIILSVVVGIILLSVMFPMITIINAIG